MRRIERLINLIAALLETERPLSAEDIRRKIAGYDQPSHDAFRRSFERDKDALRSMGIPLEVRSVPGEEVDGYIIPKDRYYLPDLDLEPDEVAALRLTASAVLGSGELAESGLMKLSVDVGRDALDWGGPRIVWGADVSVEQPLLGDLYGALLDRAPVTFEYETADGTRSTRTLEPYGIVHRAGHWYVVGRDGSRDAVRSFKVSRIRGSLEPGEAKAYEIPDGFDASAHLGGEAWQIGEETTPVTLVFDPSIAWWATQNMEGAKETSAGGAEVTMDVANLDALVSWVIGFGDRVEIAAPAEARTRLRDHLAPFLGSP